MFKIKYLIIFIFLLTSLQGKIGDIGPSLLAEFRLGYFNPEAANFEKIYGLDEEFPTVAFGLGYNGNYLLVRYLLYEEWGRSIITGVALHGIAKWREEILSIGIRSYDSAPFYFELAYAIGNVEENIYSEEREYTALNSSFSSMDNRGAIAAVGLNIPLLLGFQFSGEAEYIYLPIAAPASDKKINIGGWIYSLGISWAL
ncbi:MAG: hypothetical protein ABIA75_03515 [Candidatus Neomarinimicrobiota bacterium]